MKHLLMLFAIVGAAVFVGAACAESGIKPDSKVKYEAQMKVVGQELIGSVNSLTTVENMGFRFTPDPAVTRKAKAILTKTVGKLHDASRRISAIRPPAEVASEHAKLGQGARLLAIELGPVIKTLDQGLLVIAGGM